MADTPLARRKVPDSDPSPLRRLRNLEPSGFDLGSDRVIIEGGIGVIQVNIRVFEK